jgi:hypothetical protein
MLTGRPLFKGKTPDEVINQVKEKIIEAPSQDNPNVPKWLEELVLNSLQRKTSQPQLSSKDDQNNLPSGKL